MSVFDNPSLFYRISNAIFTLNKVNVTDNNAFQQSVTKDYDYVVDGRYHILFIDRQDMTLSKPIYEVDPSINKIAKLFFSVPGLFIFRCTFDVVQNKNTFGFDVISDKFKSKEFHLATGASTETIDHHIMMLSLMLDLS